MGTVPDTELSVLCEENCQFGTILFLQSLHRSFLIILMIDGVDCIKDVRKEN